MVKSNIQWAVLKITTSANESTDKFQNDQKLKDVQA